MRDTHYIIVCHSKKTIDYCFLVVATKWKLLTEDLPNVCRAYHEWTYLYLADMDIEQRILKTINFKKVD